MTEISIIVPAYGSQQTIAAMLDSMLAQSRPANQIIVVDSSPDQATAAAVQPYLPRITFVRSHDRLYPHEARNLGAQHATGDLLVFTDPDVVARPDWLASLERAFQRQQDVIVGGVDCLGRRWADVGVHLCKFDNWLPGGEARPVDIGPSINFCISRAAFEQVGEFPPDPMLGDTTLSWSLSEAGYVLWFEPRAAVAHYHTQSVLSLYRERFRRGREFGRIRVAHSHWGAGRILLWLLVSVLPIRLAKLMARRIRNCTRAGWLRWYGLTWPVVLVGEAGWVWGESAAYWALLRRRS